MSIAADIDYTPVGDDVIATQLGNQHTLTWHREDGNVYRDDETRVIGSHLSEHAFEVLAATIFGRLDTVPHVQLALPHAPRGVHKVKTDDRVGAEPRYFIACACGHFTTPWFETELEARAAMGAHLIKVGVVPQQRTAGAQS